MMTFEQFQATREYSKDLRAAINDSHWENELSVPKGNLYLGVLNVEQVQDHWPEAARKAGKWHLLIGRDERIRDDLESLERKLCEFAVSEGYSDEDT